MHLLITRPRDDAKAMQAKLAGHNIKTTLAPVLDLSFADLSRLDVASDQAVVVTSRNGLKSIVRNHAEAKLSRSRVYTVGEATAAYARSIGLKNLRIGPGTAEGLCGQIKSECDPARGPIHHLAGAHLAYDLKSDLETAGFNVRTTVVYTAKPAEQFSQEVIHAIRSDNVNGVVLMSARSAHIFATLCQQHDLVKDVSEFVFFCLSAAVKDRLIASLPGVQDRSVHVSERPDTEELLALITRFAAN